MPARAMWKGVIRFGAIHLPVKLYAAVEDRKVHFRLLHRKDEAPVQQKMVHSKTEEPVPSELIRRGVEIENGQIVLLDENDLKSLEPPESREIKITGFVEPSRFNHQWYDRPYYLGPDSDRKSYFALSEALQRQQMLGVAEWTMRKKNYFGVLQAAGGYLKMITLRHADEIVDVSGLQAPQFRELSRQEMQMAQLLVQALEDNFDPHAFRDEYQERVRELVMTKAAGGTVEFRKAERRTPEVISLSDMLKQSIIQAKKERKTAHG
jgi:DNA end-binding protein Ku